MIKRKRTLESEKYLKVRDGALPLKEFYIFWVFGCENIMDPEISHSVKNKLAKLQATLVGIYDSPTYSLTGVKCRATSVAKKQSGWEIIQGSYTRHF